MRILNQHALNIYDLIVIKLPVIINVLIFIHPCLLCFCHNYYECSVWSNKTISFINNNYVYQWAAKYMDPIFLWADKHSTMVTWSMSQRWSVFMKDECLKFIFFVAISHLHFRQLRSDICLPFTSSHCVLIRISSSTSHSHPHIVSSVCFKCVLEYRTQ